VDEYEYDDVDVDVDDDVAKGFMWVVFIRFGMDGIFICCSSVSSLVSLSGASFVWIIAVATTVVVDVTAGGGGGGGGIGKEASVAVAVAVVAVLVVVLLAVVAVVESSSFNKLPELGALSKGGDPS
jgi:hypothetical protein